MGLLNSKFLRVKRRKMIDKANFTSECSMESYLSTPSSSLCKLICGEKECENIGSILMESEVENEEMRKEERFLDEPNEEEKEEQEMKGVYSEVKKTPFSDIEEIVFAGGDVEDERESFQMEKLGINKCYSDNGKTYFNCIFYVPECDLIMTHYLTLYRLRLDTLSQNNFKNWCNKVGHYETLEKYLTLVNVYENMKKNHFRDAFIINRIISRQNVYFKITDTFGEENNRLRAIVVIGKRRAVLQNVTDTYCFAIKGKVTFIIKSVDDYKKYVNSSIRLKPDKWNIGTSFLSNNCRILKSRLSVGSKMQVYSTSDTYSNSSDTVNIPQNTLNDITVNLNTKKEFDGATKGTEEELYPNNSAFQKRQCDVEDVCYNNPIYCDGGTYNLVAIIADNTYAYILCRNSDMNGENYDNMDLSLINEDDLLISEYELNQSNSYHRITALKKMLRTEMLECCNKRFYGVALSKIPLGELYVVRCHINKDFSNKEKLLNEILTRHKVCGKVVNKDFELKSQIQGEIVVHLHGNENYVRSCCLELTKEGVATNLQVIHPYSTCKT